METNNSIYNDFRIQFVLKTFGGLCNNSKPFQGLHDSLFMSFTWKQFEIYQSFHTKLEFFSDEQFRAVTKSKKQFERFLKLREEAKKYYLSHYEEALGLDAYVKQSEAM